MVPDGTAAALQVAEDERPAAERPELEEGVAESGPAGPERDEPEVEVGSAAVG